MAASGLDVEPIGLMHTRRRRAVRRPVSLSRLASHTWAAARPFAPLVVFALLFGASMAVVQVMERGTPLAGSLPPVSVAAPLDNR